MQDEVRTLRWSKTCSRCGQEMPAGTELVQDHENRGPRGGKMFMHLECRPRSNPSPYYRMLAASNARREAQKPASASYLMRRRNPRKIPGLPELAPALDLYEAADIYRAEHLGRRGGRR